MFNGLLLLVLVAACVPGILVAIPRATDLLLDRLSRSGDGRLPPRRLLVVAQTAQSLVVTTALAALGVAASARTGLGAPFFERLVAGEKVGGELLAQTAPGLGLGAAGALVFLLAYYLVFRPRLDAETVSAMERLRRQSGLAGRLLYGGIVEEVLCRFGVMGGLLWGITAIPGAPHEAALWPAILCSALLFGLGHIPSYRQAGCRGSVPFYALEILLNLGAGCLFGWLFASKGLLCAMTAHATFHLAWYPFDRVLAAQEHPSAVPSSPR